MSDTILIALEYLQANPYQKRQGEDPAVVQELATNIEHQATDDFDGLLQVPTARAIDGGHYQLAFGHTRKAAFGLLFSQGKSLYGRMRVCVRDLTDLQMFEMAVAENIKRRDLNPIEQAEALDQYMTEFKKNSVDAAEFFNMTPESVRGTVRLLKTHPKVQEKLKSGEINVSEARGFLTLESIAGSEAVEEAIEDIQSGEKADEAIDSALRSNASYLDREAGWFKSKKFPVKHLKALTLINLQDEVGVDNESLDALHEMKKYIDAGMEVTNEAFPQFTPEDLEHVRVLANPPQCEQCPFHAVVDGTHWCGFKACLDRKKDAWRKKEQEDISKKLGIPLYQKSDGEMIVLNKWDDGDKKLFASGSADLRLIPAQNMWGNFDGVGESLKVVMIGEAARKRKASEQKGAEKGETSKMNELMKRQVQDLKEEFINRFSWDVMSRAFESMLDGLTSMPLLLFNYKDMIDYNLDGIFPAGVNESDLVDDLQKARKSDGLKQIRRMTMFHIVTHKHAMHPGFHYSDMLKSKKHIVKFAEELRTIAKEWDVNLPKDWLKQAEQYQAEYEAAYKELIKPALPQPSGKGKKE